MVKPSVLPISIKHAVIICIIILIIVLIVNKFQGVQGSWSKKAEIDNFIDFSLSSNRFSSASEDHKENGFESEGEKICRNFLTTILKVPFPKARPSFLKNPITSGKYGKDHNLEIDCFNEQLKLGVEYNGKQHYHYIPHFHNNFEAFRNQQYRDELKKRMCMDNGILLLEVPYTVKHKDIPMFLYKQLKASGYLRG